MTTAENGERLEGLRQKAASLPEKPGSYQYYGDEGEVIYVGKAKNLRRRVLSYFNKQQESAKTRMLVSKIRDIRYVVVKTEEDALLLENSLIKRYQPRYNVLLKDGKTYPSICISKEDFPRIYKTRRIDRRRGEYFGPYSHVETMRALLNVIGELYKPRPCKMTMTREGVKEGKYEACLNYQIRKCMAPCVGKQTAEEYAEAVGACRQILRGETDEVLQGMKGEMERLAGEMNFEEAQVVKLRYEALARYKARSEVVSSRNTDMDVLNIETDDERAYVNYLHINKGSVTQAFTFEYRKRLDETKEELLELSIVEMRQRFGSRAREVVVPTPVELPLEGVTVTVPQRGEKRRLLELSALNVRQYKFDRLKQAEKLNPEQRNVRLMKEIQEQLHMEKLPMRIELFDNSNIQGSDAVAVCVVFERLKPAKREYRKYVVKTVTGPDDYATMEEVARRRYRRMVEEGGKLPDLIITDGGQGQMERVRGVVEDELGLKIAIAGLAKDRRHRTNELLYGSPAAVVGLSQRSELFKVLVRMQDEVHRFAITFHRQRRLKRQTHSLLDDVKGVGETTKTKLLRRFKSVKRLKEADVREVQELLGKVRGAKIYEALHAAETDKSMEKNDEKDIYEGGSAEGE